MVPSSSSIPTAGGPLKGSTSKTLPTTGRSTKARSASHSTVPSAETRFAPKPSTSFLGSGSRASVVRCGLRAATGNGPSPKDGGWAFSSGGDQRIRGKDAGEASEGSTLPAWAGSTFLRSSVSFDSCPKWSSLLCPAGPSEEDTVCTSSAT